MSVWNDHVRKTYQAGKKKHGASYTYKQAMIDGKKTYKKTGAKSAKSAPKKRRGRKKAVVEEEPVGGALRSRRVKKKTTMKILEI